MRRTGYAVKTLNADNQGTRSKVVSLSEAFDRYAALKRSKSHLGPDTIVALAHVKEGRTMDRTVRFFQTESAPLPALKLTDAMAKALASAEETGILTQGRSNTLKALEDRGLVAIAQSGAAKLTNLGRQYRAQKKG